MLSITALLAISHGLAVAAPPEPIEVSDDSFKCLTDMVKVRHFFVDNLLGNLQATTEVAEKGEGVYPPGSVVQLIPGEVMVKHPKGFNTATKDWEFFELDVSKEGTRIGKRGFVDVVNKFGGNCFACHVKARPEFDMICEMGHGCDPIPITRRMLAALQKTDPRCSASAPLTEDDNKALEELNEVLKTFAKPQ
ncbi:hypothetical protein D0544_07145 [Aestuariirhabdus litorea]|uniref:Cytochrome P460 domain-containing protein n=1 Tax=Aestuariirhabdus litorea TaxID=2528527 RepID=A0A3P3VS61_9GAMM|nr:hypothetical protein D0544_07145 [Aestuariirhabdus litorea]RWW98687.1 hypothetical protein DZC74_07140 [Endozoicomonadaceae bacterium GTF-13]